MSINLDTSWHRKSFDQFLSGGLPELLAERMPLASYQVTENDPGGDTCTVMVELEGGVKTHYLSIPRPDEKGMFAIAGNPYVVVPLAESEDLERAEIACVGEQLYVYIQERLGQASNGLTWDEEILRAWLPLDRWVDEFLQSKAQPLDTTNWLSRHTHLRRILLRHREKVITSGQVGRVCPFETPEGPNIGWVFTVAIGAEIRDRRLVVVNDEPEATLGLSASMLPFLENNDPNRLLMGANMLRQGIPTLQPEPAWVQTGFEPDAPAFWCGHNLLTAFVSWGPGTSEDGIIISESAARRMNYPTPVEPGDKFSNRHGSKGVISYILPDDEMPHLPDGTPVELVYNFPGLRTRMHLGQVREAVMGRIARHEGAPVIIPPFHAPKPEEMRQRLAAAGLPETGMETLTRGRNGPSLELPSAVGWVYWTRLYHMAKDKLKLALADLPDEYAGQRLGQMECAILKELGATATLHETLNTRAARRAQFQGDPDRPPMFIDLQQRLQIAGIRAELQDGRLAFRFAQPDGEALRLARPQPHPWLSERTLEVVGLVSKADGSALPVGEFDRLVEANEKLAGMLSSRVPERLVREAETRLQAALQAFFTSLLPPEVLRMGEKQLFSGRTVLAPGADLRMDQLGIPEEVCWKLFGPRLAAGWKGQLPVDPGDPQALDALLERSWIILNRAPTFTTTAVLAFHPVRIPGRAIRLNPLICRWMNADFDGDQAAFYLPLTDAARQEAAEMISVVGQLSHNPALVKTLLPPSEVIWGLAWRSLTAEGRGEIARTTGTAASDLEPLLTQAKLAGLLAGILDRDGVTGLLEKLQSLAQLGYEAAQISGASMSPFIRMDQDMPAVPAGEDPACWEVYTEELAEKILSSTDYRDPYLGPQLLDAHARAWNRQSLPMVVGVRGVVSDADGNPFIVRHNYAEGLTPKEMNACVVGARQGFAQIHIQNEEMAQDMQKSSEPAGLNVLARARRARYAGIIFARAAATGETDPLEDVDSRLLVGLL